MSIKLATLNEPKCWETKKQNVKKLSVTSENAKIDEGQYTNK